MIGLILKDLIQMKRLIKTLGGLVVMYIVLAFLQGSSEIFITWSVVVCVVTAINSLAMDERSKWDQYALTLPFDRESLVMGKYIMLVMMSAVSAFAVLLLEWGISCVNGRTPELFLVGVGAFVGSLLSMSLMFPFIYKFGIERGRYILMAAVMIPVILVILGERAGIVLSSPVLGNAAQFVDRNPWVLLVIALGCTAVSMMISILICRKKEY